jgi:hypothetical protein
VTADELARITELGRARGAELAHTVAAKSSILRTLGWPEAVRAAQQAKAS